MRLLIAAALSLAGVSLVQAQAVRFDSTAKTTNASCASGALCPILAIPGTQVNFCTGAFLGTANTAGTVVTSTSGPGFTGASGSIQIAGITATIQTVVSSTILVTVQNLGAQTGVTYSTVSGCLANPVTTYLTGSAGTTCPTTAQLTPALGGACASTADSQGAYGAWFLAGLYYYYLRPPASAGGGAFGPYAMNVGASTGCPSNATCDANYSTLALGCTAAGTGTLYVTRAWNGLSTASYACPMYFLATGKLQPASGQTVTLAQNVFCPLTQPCYDTHLGGHVLFTQLPAQISPVQWGADPTGAADSSAAFNENTYVLQNSETNSFPGSILVPCGNYLLVANQWLINNLTTGSVIEGSGGCTTLTWKGSSSLSPVMYQGNHLGKFGHFTIQPFSSSYTAPSGIEIQQTGTSLTSQGDLFEFLEIESNYFTDGILVDLGSGSAGNNDYHTFDHVQSYGSRSGLALTSGGESYSHRIINSFLGNSTTTYGIYNVGSDSSTASSFIMEGGALSSSSWDVYINGNIQGYPIIIRGINDETLGGYVYATGYNHVLIEGGRWVNTASGTSPFQIFNLTDTLMTVRDANISVAGNRKATISFAGGLPGFLVPTIQFENSIIASKSLTYTQLFSSISGLHIRDLGLQFSDNDTSSAYYFEPNTYTTGTVTVTNGGSYATVTGSGTNWSSAMLAAGASSAYFQICVTTCLAYPISTIPSATSLTLAGNATYTGSGLSYTIGWGAQDTQLTNVNVSGKTNLQNGFVTPTTYFVGAFAGTNNHITSAANAGPPWPVADGTIICGVLNNTLQAGVNDFSYQGSGAVDILGQRTGSNLGTAWSQTSVTACFIYSNALGYWLMQGAN